MSASIPFNQLKVLLVEDQKEAREAIFAMLREMGMSNITEAPNGKEALKMMGENRRFSDLVVCDWNMPELSGLGFLQEVRAKSNQVPFLMVTGRTDAESVKKARDFDVSAYICKPFTAEQLEAKIRIVLQKSMQQGADEVSQDNMPPKFDDH